VGAPSCARRARRGACLPLPGPRMRPAAPWGALVEDELHAHESRAGRSRTGVWQARASRVPGRSCSSEPRPRQANGGRCRRPRPSSGRPAVFHTIVGCARACRGQAVPAPARFPESARVEAVLAAEPRLAPGPRPCPCRCRDHPLAKVAPALGIHRVRALRPPWGCAIVGTCSQQQGGQQG
jgi:hypothetical protein